ncbi:DUF4238 domain-containing protein [Apilactobacillus nanyangensis]|uniref:DUF4238 domain-containing protein n=1 Tax=Apilactobacillus nanyangensis TaxID=2799579 RepID=A0ABT0HWJ8_9LACO|nr:DUF4238 domain-containing protein [Apilactobacillus nanyangensis]MCK8611305.1 DUF4238 domain-containing protein [Apilactobacillus nanyangensis]
MSKTKKEHYIPQSYIKQFSKNGKIVCCYYNGDIKELPIKSILQAKTIYDSINAESSKKTLFGIYICNPNLFNKEKLKMEFTKINNNEQYVEKRLSKIENDFIQVIRGVQSSHSKGKFSLKNHHNRLVIISFFFLLNHRSPDHLSYIDNLSSDDFKNIYAPFSIQNDCEQMKSDIKSYSLFSLTYFERRLIHNISDNWNFVLCKKMSSSGFIFGEHSIHMMSKNELLFPISTNYAILIQKNINSVENIYHPVYLTDSYAYLSENEVKKSNFNQACQNKGGILVGNKQDLKEAILIGDLINKYVKKRPL